jgi:hypothetical protein
MEFSYLYAKFEDFTAVTTKNGAFLNMTASGSCRNWRLGWTYRLNIEDENDQQARNFSREI